MWLSRLPDPQYLQWPEETPSFSEHILFTEKVNTVYHYPEHRSPFGLLTFLDGDGSFCVNRKTEKPGRQQFVIVNTGSRLTIHLAANASRPALLFFQAQLPEVLAASIAQSPEQLLNDPYNTQPVDFSLLERAHLLPESLRKRLLLLTELGNGSSSFAALKADIVIRSILEDIIGENNLAVKESLNLPVKKRSTRIELYKRMCIAREWIHANYYLPVTLAELAAVTCMNSQHFLRTFKQLYLCTPHQYTITVRLDHAKQMLLTTSDTVQAICRNTGFESLSSFSGLFKQRFGKAPSHFRNKCLQ